MMNTTAVNISSNATDGPSIYEISVTILKAQLISNICWIIVSILGLAIGLLQITTTIVWKPLRKMDQSLIFALAVFDCVRTAAFGAFGVRRVYALASGGNDVGSQLSCLVWLSFTVISSFTVVILIIMLSADRLCGVAFPIWYKTRAARKWHIVQILLSVLTGCCVGATLFIGVSRDKLVPVCAYGTSPTESFLHYVEYFDNFCMYSTLAINVITCMILLSKWRTARRTTQTLSAFKTNVQLGALKMLTAIVLLYLISLAASTVCLLILNSSGFTDVTRMSYVPITGLLELLRGVFDFPLYVLLVREYRNGFREVIWKRICCCNPLASNDGINAPPSPAGVGCLAREPQNVVGRRLSHRMNRIAPS